MCLELSFKQVIVAIALLFYVLGISAFGGVAFMVLSVPLGKWTTKKTQAFQKILMKRKDDRMSVIGEALQVRRRGERIYPSSLSRFALPLLILGTEHPLRSWTHSHIVRTRCGVLLYSRKA